MKTIKGFALLALAVIAPSAWGTSYYVDSANGSDAHSGTSSNAAWQTLAKVNGTTFRPGDFVLFKTGDNWTGTLKPKGSGANGNPIVISSYGTNAAPPLFNGNGAADVVVLTNQQYWEICNLEVINPASTDAERRGIHLCAANYGEVNHLYVSNCFVHNVRGKVDTSNSDEVAKRSGGIVVEVISDSSSNTWFNDICIQDCIVMSVTNQGIVACGNRSGGHDYPGTAAWNHRHCSNLVIRGNVISDICKNAMSIRYGDESCVIEHNLIHDTANATDGNMICSYGCRGTVFQYNEGYHNNGDGAADGSLYDADLRSPLTVWQYSYSHDNSWGLFVHYASADTNGNDTNIVVRYNISQNDRGDIFALTGDGSGVVASEYFYNNTIYTPTNLSPKFFDDRINGKHTYYVYNNIFYNLSPTATNTFHSYNTRVFDYNVFYGEHPPNEPNDAHKITDDPLFIAPGFGTNGISSLEGYKLRADSPCIQSGMIITTNITGNPNDGALDFFGLSVPDDVAPARGASEWIDSTNQPLIASAQYGNGVFQINVMGDAGINYTLQSSTNLVAWEDVLTTNMPPGGFEFSDSNLANTSGKFYRIQRKP